MNKDVVDGQLVNEVNSSPEEEVVKVANEYVLHADEVAAMEVNMDQIYT